MGYWDKIAAGQTNLRLFEPSGGWRAHEDARSADGQVSSPGSRRAVEQSLGTALNATNLLLLTGAGSSFCAKNKDGKLSAPSIGDLWDAVEKAATAKVMAEVIALIPNAKDLKETKNVEKLLTLSKLYVELFNDANSKKVDAFIRKAEQAILDRVDFVDAATDISTHRTFLRKVARRGIRKPRTKIFTTNYDLCFEQAAAQQQFVAIDGFSHSTPQTYDRAHYTYDIVRRDGAKDAPDYIENVFHLYKLHGSLDWRESKQGILRSRDNAAGDPVLIYPRDTKYQEAFAPPYLDMMSALQAALREPDTALVISGFGFRDDHIGKPIMAAVEANLSIRVIVCDVVFLKDDALQSADHVVPLDEPMRAANEYLSQLRALAEAGDTRISLLNGRFEDLADAVPDLVAETERERHIQRMLRSRDLKTEQET